MTKMLNDLYDYVPLKIYQDDSFSIYERINKNEK